MSSNQILVFIAGPSPTKAELALAKKYSTRCFRNASAHSEGNSEPHRFAVAVSEDLIPSGYKREGEEEAASEEASTPEQKAEAAKLPWTVKSEEAPSLGIASTEE